MILNREEIEQLLKWDSALDTGMAVIDQQHKVLIENFKLLLDRSREDRVAEILQFLQNYVVEHFGHEEALHEETKYPGAEEHLEIHNAFIQDFLKMKREYEADEEQQRLITLLKLIHTLTVWVKNHIMGMDQKFAAYYFDYANGKEIE